MRSITITALLSVFLLASCTNTATEEGKEEAVEVKQPVASKLDETGTEKLESLLTQYYALKDALVASNSEDAAKAAEALKTEADSFASYLSADSATLTSTATELDSIATTSAAIAGLTDIEEQRIPFETVSDNMFALLRKAELKNAGVYQQYCPMAKNDVGAHWLSNEEDIKNPYFGKKMLTCGEVTDSLR